MNKVVLIDDERLARSELRRMLQEFPDVEVIGEAANAEEGIEKTFNMVHPPHPSTWHIQYLMIVFRIASNLKVFCAKK